MTHGQVATTLALAAGLISIHGVGFFTGFANTWPIIVFVLVGAYLLDRK